MSWTCAADHFRKAIRKQLQQHFKTDIGEEGAGEAACEHWMDGVKITSPALPTCQTAAAA